MSKTVYFNVPSVMCSSCSDFAKTIIKAAVQNEKKFCDDEELERKIAKIVTIEINRQTRILRLVFASDNTDPALMEAIVSALKTEFTVGKSSAPSSYVGLMGLLSVAAGIAVMFFPLSPMLVGMSVLAALFLGKDMYYRALHCQPMDVLLALSIFFLISISVLGLWFPAIHSLFSMAFFTIGAQHIGAVIREWIQSKESQFNLLSAIPPWYVPEGSSHRIDSLTPGAMIELPQGAIIPVDVTSDSDCELLDIRSDGQTHTRHIIKKGKIIKQGMERPSNVLGSLKVTVEKTYSDSHLFKIQRKVEALQQPNDPAYFKTFLRYFFPTLVAVALLTGVVHYFYLVYLVTGVSGMFSHAYFYSFLTALSTSVCVLTSACPCSLGLISGLSSFIMRQSMLKNKMEPCFVRVPDKEPNHYVFDLNGTLTETHPIVKNIQSFNLDPEEDLEKIIYSLEQGADHPFASTICNYLFKKKVAPYGSISDRLNKDRSSIEKVINGVRYRISDQLHHIDQIDETEKGKTITYVERMTPVFFENKEAEEPFHYEKIGMIEMDLIWRDHSINLINDLIREGKTVHICTGAKQIFLPDAIENKDAVIRETNYAPEDKEGKKGKLNYILSLKEKGHSVVMVGDSGNDVLPLAASDIAITMESDTFDLASKAVSIFSITSFKDFRHKIKTVQSCGEAAKQFGRTTFWVVTLFSFLTMFLPMLLTLSGCAILPIGVEPFLALIPLLPLGISVFCYYEKVSGEPSVTLRSSSASIRTSLGNSTDLEQEMTDSVNLKPVLSVEDGNLLPFRSSACSLSYVR